MFDRAALIAACKAHGRVVRVVIASVHGSAPREVGAAMLVWDGGQSGTIGGGALEYELTQKARDLNSDIRTRHALGPDLGQCCGGAVEVLSEIYDLARAEALDTDIVARGPDQMPLSVTRMAAAARNQGQKPKTQLCDRWFVEPVCVPDRDVWIWGAGHVGRAIVDILHKTPGCKITWVDTATDRFPDNVPSSVTTVPATDPAVLMPHAPTDAVHLILTYSHALDLALCHAALAHGFTTCGLIGSATKWARFRKRLTALGHSSAQVSRITCPIGDPSLGKDPHLIAIGVAYRMARMPSTLSRQTEATA